MEEDKHHVLIESAYGKGYVRTCACTFLLIYIFTAPFRGEGELTMIPNIALVSAAILTVLSASLSGVVRISWGTLVLGSLFAVLVVNNIVLNSFHPMSELSELAAVKRFFLPFVIFWLPSLLLDDENTRWFERWFWALVVSSGLVAVLTIAVSLGVLREPMVNLTTYTYSSRIGLPFYATSYPLINTRSMIYLSSALAIALSLSVSYRHLLSEIMLGVLLLGVVLSQVRKTYIAVLVTVLLYFLLNDSYRGRTIQLTTLISPLIVLVLSWILLWRPPTSRIQQYLAAVPFAIRHPLGAGPGGFEAATGIVAVHNIMLNALTQFGFMAFSLVVAIVLLVIVRAFRQGLRTTNPLVLGLSAGIIGIFVGLMVESRYFDQRLWLLVGLLFAYTDLKTDVIEHG